MASITKVLGMSHSVLFPSIPAIAGPMENAVKIELDERAFLFPDGKSVTHIVVTRDRHSAFQLEAVFAFNKTKRNPRFATLSLHQMREFVRELLGAVYHAKTSFVLDDTLKIAINVTLNGYIIEFTRSDEHFELFLGTGSIWRVVKSLLMVVDEASPVVAN
jgi:hypothetical protein